MTIQFRCKGCNHERTESESDHARKGFCVSCDAKGVGLQQIKKIEKWEARDGTFHDSREAAQQHQLKVELETALKVGEGYVQRQAMHLLSHFDIVRKGDMPKGVVFMPLLTPPGIMEGFRPACLMWGGFFAGSVLTGLIMYGLR